ncbi:sugar-binding transcriptional regulator [Vagococcus silagei]|uniref:SorC family transcriptional regulator n=1 Tax=Vagococcus silagei TaxID=2508885 RepID=A0A4S3B722_9ENTE|nr:sugar-binding domain-containing protein [Vagococcus silagei]THB60475.1 SorC family transcriptional regulator [Vagococcus silagei]
MSQEIEMIERIAPDIIQVVEERFRILRNIYWMQPVGRRTLALKLDVTERVLRTETDYLKQIQLIDTSKSGMSLTDEGLSVYRGLETFIDAHAGMRKKERTLARTLGIDHCIVVSGDSDQDRKVLEEFGSIVTDVLKEELPERENVVAVMGGTTMATVAKNMDNLETEARHNLFVPARGGIGEMINIQANSICAMMAEKTGGDFRVLYVPEQVSPETYDILLQEPTVQKVLGLISNADCVIHSIGRALHMAKRRGMKDTDMAMLTNKKAVAESFGYFFNAEGEVVYKIPRIGLQLKDLKEVQHVVAVAGGKSKAKAIQAYVKNAPSQTWLITDEGACDQILKEATL